MPPKQKEVKKGPAYKNAILTKDIVPSDIKQPPRELKSLKYPETFPEPPKNDKKINPIFQAWPTQQVIKAFDFGVVSESKYEDPHHQSIVKNCKNQNIVTWKSIHEIQKLKAQTANKQPQNHESLKSIDEGAKSANNVQLSRQQEIQEGPPKVPVVIQTYERDQTPLQTQTRLKDEAQKAEKAAKDKKKGKKQEPKQQGPIKVKDVKMGDIKVEKFMAEQGIWIGSQLQIIKLRNLVDAYNKQPIWKKIYPQENGVPQITKSGKYWVKLYYMSQPVKIQIDDRLPINYNSKQMLPVSDKRHEKWTLLLTKALLKLMAIACPNEKISGSGLIFHALTGMICQNISLKGEEMNKFENLLNDSHYTKKDIFVSCYTDKLKAPPSNNMKHPSSGKQFFLLDDTQIKNKNHRKISAQNLQIEQAQNQMFYKQEAIYEEPSKQPSKYPIQSHIIAGYSYLLGDYFTNGQFNMAFSKQKSLKQTKLRLEYSNLSKVNLNNKTRQEKLEHRRKKKEIKELLAIEEMKRLDLINEEKKQYHFIKLLNKSVKIRCEFDQKQILLAKKCRLNKLNQPPNYELPQVVAGQKDQRKSMKSLSLIKTAKQESEVNPNIDDFSMIQNAIDPLQRPDQGIWIKDVDFLACFSNVQIIYNPASFQNKSISKISATDSKVYTFDENKQILVLEKVQLNQEGLQSEHIDLLIGFSYQQNYDENATKPYCILQKFDFDQFSVINNVTKLSSKIDSNHLTLKNQNNVFKIYTICKGSYTYWVSSNAKFKLMSISEYLEEFQGYKKKVFTVQYPALEANNYFSIARYNLKQGSEEKNSVILKINAQNSELVKSFDYNLVKIPKEGEKYVSLEKEGIIQKTCQRKFLAVDYTRLTIEPGQQYDLVVQSCPFENIVDGSCEIIALIKNQSLELKNLEQVEPLRMIEKYKPNKYGLIFRERVFSNILSKQSFLIKIVEGQEVQGGDKKAPPKKGTKEQVIVTQFTQKPLQKSRKIIVRLIQNKQVVYETIGTNWLSISNISLPNIKQKNQECFLEAYFDLREWGDAKTQNQDTNKLCWTISSFGTESIALVRDTRQQDKQKQTRKSWEEKQPGRAERAKKSRKRYLIMQKKENGQQLTEEQEQIADAPRLTKKQLLQEEKKNEDKNKKGGKKDDKKAGKDAKKEQVEQKPVQIIFPKSIDNCNYEIRNFLKTLESFSVKHQTKPQDQQAKIRSEEQLRAIKDSQKMSDENRIGKLLKNVQRRQTIKLKERDRKDQLLLHLEQLNKNFKDNWSKYVGWRNEDIQKDKGRQEKQRNIVDILKQDKPALSQADIDKVLNEYKQIPNFNKNLYDVGVMLKKNIKIAALSDKIAGHLTGWQVDDLKAINQQIGNQKIQGISENIIKDMKTMLEQVQKNPGIVLQKQNQAKKAKKGGKK